MDRTLANDNLDGPALSKWSSRWTSLLQIIIWIDQPLANDHLDGPAFCKWSSGWTGLLQIIRSQIRDLHCLLGLVLNCNTYFSICIFTSLLGAPDCREDQLGVSCRAKQTKQQVQLVFFLQYCCQMICHEKNSKANLSSQHWRAGSQFLECFDHALIRNSDSIVMQVNSARKVRTVYFYQSNLFQFWHFEIKLILKLAEIHKHDLTLFIFPSKRYFRTFVPCSSPSTARPSFQPKRGAPLTPKSPDRQRLGNWQQPDNVKIYLGKCSQAFFLEGWLNCLKMKTKVSPHESPWCQTSLSTPSLLVVSSQIS